MTDFANLQADALSVDGFANKNGLIPTRYGGSKKSWQYLVDQFEAEFAKQLLEINKSRGYRVVGTFAAGFDYELFNDVGIDASGNSWIYVGAGAPAKTVTAGTVPSAPDYQQVTFNSIDGVVGLRDELNDRALYLTLAEAQAKTDLTVGQHLKFTDRDLHTYIVVQGLTPNDKDIVNVGGGKQAQIVIDSAAKCSLKSLGWSFGDDASPYAVAAASIGVKEFLLPKSVVSFSEIELDSSFQTMKIKGVGGGFAYTPQTTIRPFNNPQVGIFVSRAGVSGVDNVKFEGVKFEGNDTTDYAVRQLSGAGWEFKDIQAEGFNEWALYSEQGLNQYQRLFIKSDNATGTGCIAVYSDYFVDRVEVTGGGVGLKIMAGGGRVSDLLANSQSESCVVLEPLDTNTNHINTSLVGLYIGEVFNPAERSILKIKGNATRRVTDVQITNLHTVSASTTGIKHNLHCEIENADRVTFNAWQALGIGSFETANLWDSGGLKATNSTDIELASGCLHNLSKTPVEVINSSVAIGDTMTIRDWGGAFATGNELSAVVCQDSTSRVAIGDFEYINDRVANTKAGSFSDGSRVTIGDVLIATAGTLPEDAFEFTSNPVAYNAKQLGVGSTRKFGSTYTYKGTFSSGAGGGSVQFFTLPNLSENASYELSIQQSGTGANATLGKVFANGSNTGLINIGNANSNPDLQNDFSISGLDLTANIGSGYITTTTWLYQLTRCF